MPTPATWQFDGLAPNFNGPSISPVNTLASATGSVNIGQLFTLDVGTMTFGDEGGIPTGVSFNTSTGVYSFSGSQVAGVYEMITRAFGGGSPASYTDYSWVWNINAVANPPVLVGAIDDQLFKASGTFDASAFATGQTSYSADMVPSTGGVLPNGVTFNNTTGLFTINTAATGSALIGPIQVTYINSTGSTVSNSFNFIIQIAIPSTLAIATNTLPQATLMVPYSAVLAATGGTPPYTWALTSGVLQAGLSLDAPSGTISGTTNVAATVSLTFSVTDSLGAVVSKPLSLTSGGVQPQCAAPTFSPPSGTPILAGTTITLSSATPGATIYYTLDGTIPDNTVASGTAVVINPGQILNAIAYANGYMTSVVTTATYPQQSGTGDFSDATLQLLLDPLTNKTGAIIVRRFDVPNAISYYVIPIQQAPGRSMWVDVLPTDTAQVRATKILAAIAIPAQPVITFPGQP